MREILRRRAYNRNMKKTTLSLIALLLLSQALVLAAGCGGGVEVGIEEEVVGFTIENLLVPAMRDSDFLVQWMRRSTGAADVSPEALGLRFWKWEGGALAEIGGEEFRALASGREGGDPRIWTYSQHSITVLSSDAVAGEAVVEVGSLYGPLSGSGVRYLLRREEGGWVKVSQQTVWVSRGASPGRVQKLRARKTSSPRFSVTASLSPSMKPAWRP